MTNPSAEAEPRPSRLVRLGMAIGWLLCAIAVAFGGAGIVSGVGGPPGSASRPELTAAGDDALLPLLGTATADLQHIRDDVDKLASTARGALAATIGGDTTALNAAVDAGQTLADSIATESDALRQHLQKLPGVEGATTLPLPPELGLRMSAATERRYAQLVAAVDATNGLSAAWLGLTSGTLAARQLTEILDRHDLATLAAAKLGRETKYAAAVKQLDASDAAIADARTMRNRLAVTVDVSTLDQWLGLYSDYDHALRSLYSSLAATKGRVTQQVRDAYAALSRAHDRLPGDTRAFVVILGDIAKGGMNQAIVTIEQAKARLNDALTALAASDQAGASPSPAP